MRPAQGFVHAGQSQLTPWAIRRKPKRAFSRAAVCCALRMALSG
jgi:hypothetical protein